MGNIIVNTLLFQPPQRDERDKLRYKLWRHRAEEILLVNNRRHAISTVFIEPRHKITLWTILYSHANAEDLSSIANHLESLSNELNVNVYAYDYSGYGESGGNCSEENCYENISDALKFLNSKGIHNERIILYGRSLGSGPTCYIASKMSLQRRPLGGIILHAAFTSIFRIMVKTACTLESDYFANIDHLRFFHRSTPILVVHGEKDRIVPFGHALEIVDELKHVDTVVPLFLYETGHNSMNQKTKTDFFRKVSLRMTNYNAVCRFV